MLNFNKIFFKYFVYYPVTIIRGEWIFGRYRNLKKSQFYNDESLQSIQLSNLKKLLLHAKGTVPHYSKSSGCVIDSLEDLKKMPFLEKQDIRDNEKEFFSSSPGVWSRYKTSGGSTGAPVTIRKNSAGMASELAATWRGYSWAGIDIGDKQARFWGVPHTRKARIRSKLIDFIANRIRFSAFSFSESDLKEYARKLVREKPIYYYGYVSMIRRFAEYIEENLSDQNFRPRAIITTAEILSPEDREVIERVFKCKVFNEYGCGEIGTIAHECTEGTLHINSENILVEVIDEFGRRCPEGVIGELVVTDLTNYSMPLIRYKLKDFAALEKCSCPCGVNLPSLKQIYGREYNYLVNSEGKKFHAEFFLYFFEDLKKEGISLKELQIVQDEFFNLTISIVSDSKSFSVIEKRIRMNISERFDPAISVVFKKVDRVPREPSGKLIVVKSEALKS